MITRFYLPLLSTNVKQPKFGCHVTSLCQGLRRSAGSGAEDPENQVVSFHLPLCAEVICGRRINSSVIDVKQTISRTRIHSIVSIRIFS